MGRTPLTTITPKQQQVYDYIIQYGLEHNTLPTIREICDGLDMSSTSICASMMRSLERLGYVTKTMNRNGYIVRDLRYIRIDTEGKK